MKIRLLVPILLGGLLPAAGWLLRSEVKSPARPRQVRRAVEMAASVPEVKTVTLDPVPTVLRADPVRIDSDRLEGISREGFLATALAGSEEERVAAIYAFGRMAGEDRRIEVLAHLERAYRLDVSERVRGEALDGIVGFADAGDARAQETLARLPGVCPLFDPEIERALTNLEDEGSTSP